MAKVSYEQARKDHEYLWSIGPAYDMTGGYTDQEDLDRLLRNPTKTTARDCYVCQIEYWFMAGPTGDTDDHPNPVPWKDPRVVEISSRYHTPFRADEDSDDE
ncbi:hypothetical protein GOZ83_22085 [Agrobacterium vitis]|uniref:hypothetical protein n=1 Tax=Agrobacterium vitis TaxID=373 RepID=UPI0012E8754A|nr:hypothetical protein [Agrobacterium vitis]MVA47753.1 hypothetical protein [Agrobacterium vitis]